jgi:hypothetical protein
METELREQRRRKQRAWGAVLIWLGVLAWVPFFILLAVGRDVSIFPFLALHLTGVISGTWLRSRTDAQAESAQQQPGRRRRIVSRIMIYLGVLAWAPYFYLDRVVGQEVEMGPFLAVHLTGVLGGAALRASVELDRFVRRK